MNDNRTHNHSSFSPSVSEQLKRGNTIKAIKLLREETGMSLLDAKNMIESASTESPVLTSSASSSAAVSHAVLDQLMQGKKIDAIKVLRGETGIGLKDAKEAVEQAMRDHPEVNMQFQEINKKSLKHALYRLLFVSIAAYFAYHYYIGQ